jgi:hypothetical protein
MGILSFGNVPAAASALFPFPAHAMKPDKHVFLIITDCGFPSVASINYRVNLNPSSRRTILVAWSEHAKSRLAASILHPSRSYSSESSDLAFIEQAVGRVAAV